MGQSSSTQRNHRHDNHLENILSLQAARGRVNSDADMNHGRGIEQTGDFDPQSGPGINNSGPHNPASGQQSRSAESWHPLVSPEQPGTSRHMASIEEENGSQYDSSQREYRSAIFARMAARRQSTMSRLGSRILPNSVIRGLLSSEEETPAEGHAHRHGVVSRTLPRSEVTHNSSRFSPFSSFSSRGISRRRSARGPYFIPRSDPGLIPDTTHSPTFFDPATDHAPENTRGSWRRSARLHRMRHSLSSPITHMFGQPSSNMTDHPSNVQQTPMDSMSNESPHNFLPHPGPVDTRMDFDEPHELDSVEPAVGSARPTSPMSSQSAQGSTSLRQFPGLLRARSSRAARREEQTPLSRVLQLAAAAIAAQLSGTTGPVMPNIQALGNDGLDGSLENFIQSLQHATSTQTTPNDTPGPSGDTGNAPATPVNFLRVFRFANSESPGPLGMPNRSEGEPDHTGRGTDGMDLEDPVDEPEGRRVTLVVVGVRSVPSGNGPGSDQQANGGPGLDALLRLPFLSPGSLSRGPERGPGFARGEGRPRFPSTHRNSIGSPGSLTTNGDTLQSQGQQSPSRRLSDNGGRVPLSSVPSVLSESPPGPHPPPSTPAEPGLSAVSSGASTPSRRPSSASMMPPSILPQLDENRAMQPTVEVDENPPFTASHQRRRSDSEYARHRDLGSGAVRRNGVVEPDHAPPPAGRSWLIYVVGTNLSENHPAFATPSLFTDVRLISTLLVLPTALTDLALQNPTYEDMILLSSLLGPVKPPVATQEELSSAGGLFRLVEYGGSLTAEALDGAGTLQVPDGDRCLICLSDYEAAEELRQLNKCKHVFHRDCIDQVRPINPK